MRGPIRSVLLAAVTTCAFGAMTATPALAVNEFLHEEKGGAALVPVGTNFVAENVGKATLVAGATTVTCNEVDVGGTLTKNKKVAPEETPVAEVQSVVFGGCSETTAPKGRVVVKTVTTPAWTLKWKESVGKFVLEGVNAKLELLGAGVACTVKNAAAAFNLSWLNDPDGFELAELEAAAQPLALTGTSCPAEGKETVTLKFEAEGVADKTGKMWLE